MVLVKENGSDVIKDLISCIVNNRKEIENKINGFSPRNSLDISIIANLDNRINLRVTLLKINLKK